MGLPLWKNVNFSTFWTFSFYSLERRFFVLEYHKRHFPGLYCLKKKVGKMTIFGPKPCFNPVGKLWISGLLELFFYYGLERRFFNLEYRKRHFPSIYCLNQIAGKMAIFGSKPWINSFEKMLIFRVFDLRVFIG